MDSIAQLSDKIWKHSEIRPNRRKTQAFDAELKNVSIKDFIVFNFQNYFKSATAVLMLSTFHFWKTLTYEDWKDIFNRLEGNSLSEYYLTVFSREYLGLDLYKSIKDVNITTYIVADDSFNAEIPTSFIYNSKGSMRQFYIEYLWDDFELSIEDFAALNQNLFRNFPKRLP